MQLGGPLLRPLPAGRRHVCGGGSTSDRTVRCQQSRSHLAAPAAPPAAAGSSIHHRSSSKSSSKSSKSSSRPPPGRQRAAAAGGGAGDAPQTSSSSGSSATVVEPFSEEQLRSLTSEEGDLDEAALAEAWREGFEGDIDGLYDYVDRDQIDLRAKVAEMHSVPRHLWDKVGLLDELKRFPPGLVTDMMGMGTWRLKGMVDEVLDFLVTRVENSFRELLDTDLALYPADKWKGRGWDFIDSLDLHQEWGGFSYVDMPDPQKGQEGYPRLMIENRCYSSRVFRKLHLEVARRQDGLQVLHMVLYPRYDFDIPILAMDLVAAGGALTLAIIDACPVTPRLTLPSHYAQTMAELQHHFLPESLLSKEGRSIPAWGAAIFSPLCLCISPQSPEELAGFMKYAVALTRAHLMYSRLLEPLRPTDKPSARRLQELLACHKRFCDQQLANKKTARVLEAAFDAEFTEAYMSQLMFDFAPSEDVPVYDASLGQLFDYFEAHPEVWADAGLFLETKFELDEAKAADYLRRFLAGDASIKLPRLGFAMQQMYDADESFQAAVDRYFLDQPPETVPDTAEMGEWLAAQLMAMVEAKQQQQSKQQQSKQQQDGGASGASAPAAAAAEQQQQPESGGGATS